jgi:hypothetical protein
MSAVAEAARDPSAIKKYANNPKVRQLPLWSAERACPCHVVGSTSLGALLVYVWNKL